MVGLRERLLNLEYCSTVVQPHLMTVGSCIPYAPRLVQPSLCKEAFCSCRPAPLSIDKLMRKMSLIRFLFLAGAAIALIVAQTKC